MTSGPILGLALSSEENPPAKLVETTVDAERAGFTFAIISDHYHPWLPCQGQSPFVWTVLGAMAARTSTITLGTGVTCPIIRTHPAVIAQAAATTAALSGDRFWLGLGTGERLNEHVVGAKWPPVDVRQEMLEEAVDVIRQLWTGEEVDHHGRHFDVENARVYTLPSKPPEIMVAASGPIAASAAGRIGDGLISTSPTAEIVEKYQSATNGSGPGPRIGQLSVCWAQSEKEARSTARQWWPNAALHGPTSQELARPEDFEALSQDVTEDQVASAVVCGPDPQKYIQAVDEYAKAGFDHVYFHQIGPDQQGFIEFAKANLL